MTTDFRRRRDGEGRLILVALAASVLVHLLLIVSVAGLLIVRPGPLETSDALTPEETVQITLVDPPEAPPQQALSYIDTPAQEAETPDNPDFESDKNARAASPLPATGTAPLPTQEGMDVPFVGLENKEYIEGGIDPTVQAQEPIPPAPAPAAPPVQAQVPPAPPEVAPQPTPVPSELALLTPPQPNPAAVPPQPQKQPVEGQLPETPATEAAPPKATPPPGKPAFQSPEYITRIEGNISNRGKSSVAAAATPIGRYKKYISDAVGSRWQYYVKRQMDMVSTGSVKIRFVVLKDGTVEKVQVLKNTSNETFAALTVRAVSEAEIPPIPADILPMLKSERLEIDWSFMLF